MPGSVAALALLVAIAAQGVSLGQDDVGYRLEIGLPADSPASSVENRGDSLYIVLPVQADYPGDLQQASGGLLGPAVVELMGNGKVAMSVPLRGAELGKVEFDSRRLRISVMPSASFVEAPALTDAQYRLGPDDKITLTVHNDPDLTRVPLTVTKDGTVSAPLVGEVRAEGFTVRELGAELAAKLDQFIVDPQVDVSVDEYNSQWAMVMGEVRRPGRVPLKGGTTLKEVLGDAQGFSDTAGEVIHLSRKQSRGGSDESIIRRAQFESGADNPVLSHGDIVTVARATFCYVQGEVRSPGRVQIERGMTLLRAITMVGGLTEWAKEKSVIVLSDGDTGEEREFNLKAIRNGKADDPPLYGGEVVVVKKRVL
ncbi:hypothetical protein ABI59_04745 [Acidobacteria bacterium Mor1]|nr:hypothetical protein ABI59_04745 [Acidobacteria bacterium Mor1]